MVNKVCSSVDIPHYKTMIVEVDFEKTLNTLNSYILSSLMS